jgi:hypothetical protein
MNVFSNNHCSILSSKKIFKNLFLPMRSRIRNVALKPMVCRIYTSRYRKTIRRSL